MANVTSSPVTKSSGPWNNDLLLEEFRAAILFEHNKHRADHGSPPLRLNAKLNAYAQEWANSSAEMEDMVHRPDPDENVGECLQARWWPDTTIDTIGTMVCDDFYNEIFNFDFDKGGFAEDTAHFTQVVWYDTTDIGVGMAIGESGRAYCVVNYTPQGNIEGGYRSNVLPIGTKYEPKPELTDQTIFIPPKVTSLSHGFDLKLFQKLLTNQHNIYRKHYCVPYLQNVEYLNEIAQFCAERCAELDQVEHSDSEYGENISVYYSFSNRKYYPTPLEICKGFKEQEVDYQYDEDTDHVALHFTQMIWKSSKEIGIGMKKAPSGMIYVVCLYNPPGNIHGEYSKNVLRFKPIKIAPVKVNIGK